jgi:hypothetical protein
MAYLANNGSNSNSGLNLSKSSGTESSNFGTGQTSKKQVNKLPNAGWANLKDYLSKNTVNPEAMAAKAVSTVKTPTFTIPTAPERLSSSTYRPENISVADWNPTSEQEDTFNTALNSYSTQLAGVPEQFTADLENSRNTAENLKVGEGESNASYWSRITGNNNTQGENALNNALLSGTKTPDLYGQVSSGLDAAEASFNEKLPGIQTSLESLENARDVTNQTEYMQNVLKDHGANYASQFFGYETGVGTTQNKTFQEALAMTIKPWMSADQKSNIARYLGTQFTRLGGTEANGQVTEYYVNNGYKW